jgi:hypothetical protein
MVVRSPLTHLPLLLGFVALSDAKSQTIFLSPIFLS